jgi:hypothetical protein
VGGLSGNLDVEVFSFVARIASLEHIYLFRCINDNTQGGVEPQNLEAKRVNTHWAKRLVVIPGLLPTETFRLYKLRF